MKVGKSDNLILITWLSIFVCVVEWCLEVTFKLVAFLTFGVSLEKLRSVSNAPWFPGSPFAHRPKRGVEWRG